MPFDHNARSVFVYGGFSFKFKYFKLIAFPFPVIEGYCKNQQARVDRGSSLGRISLGRPTGILDFTPTLLTNEKKARCDKLIHAVTLRLVSSLNDVPSSLCELKQSFSSFSSPETKAQSAGEFFSAPNSLTDSAFIVDNFVV